MSQTNLRETIWARVRVECSKEISACYSAIQAHRKLVDEMSTKSLLPGQAASMIEKLSRDQLPDPTAERLLAHARILADLRSISANPSVQFNARRAANLKFMVAEPAVLALEKAVADSLDRQIAELVKVEQSWFAQYGLPYEPTAVSRLAASLKEVIHVSSFARGRSQIMGLDGASGEYMPMLDIYGMQMLFAGEKAQE